MQQAFSPGSNVSWTDDQQSRGFISLVVVSIALSALTCTGRVTSATTGPLHTWHRRSRPASGARLGPTLVRVCTIATGLPSVPAPATAASLGTRRICPAAPTAAFDRRWGLRQDRSSDGIKYLRHNPHLHKTWSIPGRCGVFSSKQDRRGARSIQGHIPCGHRPR